jgi:hypothetical protein
MVQQRRLQVASFIEKLVLEKCPPLLKLRRIKGELQPVRSPNLYISSSMPVRFWEVPKKNKRSILPSCASGYPERTKVATGYAGFFPYDFFTS